MDDNPGEKWEREPPAGQREVKLGQGLALVARYVKQTGGQIRGRSILGEGSTFPMDIPMELGKNDVDVSTSHSARSRESAGDASQQVK